MDRVLSSFASRILGPAIVLLLSVGASACHYGRPGGPATNRPDSVTVLWAGAFRSFPRPRPIRLGSENGGPYTHGPFPNPFAVFGRTDGQFMLMDVQDDGGDEVCITWTGKRHEIDTGRVVELLKGRKCFPVP